MNISYEKAVGEELRPCARDLRRTIPDVYQGYKQLLDAALSAGALDTRTKELIGLTIAISKE